MYNTESEQFNNIGSHCQAVNNATGLDSIPLERNEIKYCKQAVGGEKLL